MNEEFQEYVTFSVTASDGRTVEMAVMDEFDYEHKHYVVGAVIEDNTVKEDGLYIYRAKIKENDFTVEKITNHVEYEKISRAYMEMDEMTEE